MDGRRGEKGHLEADVRAPILLLTHLLRHGDFPSISVHKKAARFVGTKIEVGVVRAHDAWVLLTPLGLAGDLDDNVGLIVNLGEEDQSVVEMCETVS